MRKKNNTLLEIIKQDILNNTKSYIVVIGIFIIGILFGVIFINQMENKDEITNYINTYIDETKTIQSANFMEELKDDVKQNTGLVFLLWFAGTTIIGIPIVLALILFRGFCLGYTISTCVYVLGKIKGLIFVLITILMQNIIYIPALIILGVSSIKLYKSIIKDKRKENIKISILKHTITSIIVLIALIIASIIKIEISYRLIINLVKYF